MTQGALAGRLAAIVASVERRLAERQARRPEAVLERAVEEVLAREPAAAWLRPWPEGAGGRCRR